MAIGNGGLVLEPTETDGAGFKLGRRDLPGGVRHLAGRHQGGASGPGRLGRRVARGRRRVRRGR